MSTGAQSAAATLDLRVQKYYQPWLSTVVSELPNSQGRGDLSPSSESPTLSRKPDAILTALAQLVALKSDTDRCTVALLDSTFRYSLAEASRDSNSLEENVSGKDNARIYNWQQDKAKSIDAYVYQSIYTLPATESHSQGSATTTVDALVIRDVTQDAKWSAVCPDQGQHSDPIKFYAGVPIYSADHGKIGVCAVTSVLALSDGAICKAVLSMRQISKLITQNLASTKDTIAQERGEQFVKSISSFVEELSSVKHKLDGPGENARKIVRRQQSTGVAQATDPQEGPTSDRVHVNAGSDPSMAEDAEHSAAEEINPDDEQYIEQEPNLPKHTREIDTTTEKSETPSQNNIRQIFASAARIIHHKLDAQGCVFLDVNADTSLFKSSDLSSSQASSLEPSDDSDTDTGTNPDINNNDEHRMSDKANPSESKPKAKLKLESEPDSSKEDSAPILGTSVDADCPLSATFIERKQLRQCLRRFPYGVVFRLQDGHVYSTDQSTFAQSVTGGGPGTIGGRKPRLLRHPSSGDRYIPKAISTLLPHARWIIFLPLYNYAQRRWYASAFIWSTDLSCANPEDEMTYLKAFGSCIMSEVTSMSAFNTNRAKSDFIASISHELRSPLHGILGSLEFLEDTMNSAYQMSLLGSIQTCGRTLLDTIDHLLDYAKINNLNKAVAKRAVKKQLVALAAEDNDTDEDESSKIHDVEFDLALLVEEVVETVFAGQTFRRSQVRGKDSVEKVAEQVQDMTLDNSKSTEDQIHEGSAKFSGRVFIVLDISPAQSWTVESQPGALRRVIMNVFGNAIKYCNSGVIEVSLRVLDQRNEQLGEEMAEIIVRDSGRGMSKDFLDNDLSKPFAQEDSFVAGAGLGLSITKQIMDTLRGKIIVRSEKDVGTHVSLDIPLKMRKNPGEPQDNILRSATEAAKGKTICLLNPVDVQKGEGRKKLSRLTISLARMCRDWFGMTFIESNTIDVEADVFVYAEPPPIEYLMKHHSERRKANLGEKEAALLIICTNAFEAASLRGAGITHLSSLGRIIEVINQPVGIRKFARVLLQSLQLVEAAQSKSETEAKPASDEHKNLLRTSFETGDAETRAEKVGWSENLTVYDALMQKHRPAIDRYRWKSEQPMYTGMPGPSVLDGEEKSAGKQFANVKYGATLTPSSDSSVDMTKAAAKDDPERLPSILVVDDNAINLKLLVTFVKKLKLPYAEAMNGKEAFEKFRAADTPFKFVLMDLQMPVMDGLESTRKIREYEDKSNCQNPSTIIAITGVGSEETKKEAMDSGMTQFLTKPVSFKVLKQVLESHSRT